MKRIESLIMQYDQIAKNARKTIERVPDDKFGWKPHEKSSSMGDLAAHIANLQTWINMSLDVDEFDMNPVNGESIKSPKVTNQKELIELFDKSFESAKKCLENTPDEKLDDNWSLMNQGQVLFTMPKISVVHNFVLHHLIHHNAQLGVYLRLNDIPVPALYGPSADEQIM